MSVAATRSIDEVRLAASGKLDPERREALGQFMTPSVIADFMASMFQKWPAETRLLDPGAGIGSLTEAFANLWLRNAPEGATLQISTYEIEPLLIPLLRQHLAEVRHKARGTDRSIDASVEEKDFISEASFSCEFGAKRFSHAILNPPYKKIGSNSEWRHQLRHAGIETVNLYAAFLALAVASCEEGGEIVAIVPRSFCNGTYFRPFRAWLLERVALRQAHIFGSRKKAFQDDNVLQENIIIRLERGGEQAQVKVSSSTDAAFHDFSERDLPFEEIVKPSDPEQFIHIPTEIREAPSHLFNYTLAELGLGVATGPVVDFRLRDHCLSQPANGAVPLLYAHHFRRGAFEWPKDHRKPNAIAVNDVTLKWLMPRGWYALTKRFSSKEERRRIVSFVVDPDKLPFDQYGFENHLNVVHSGKRGLTEDLARGIALFLNSTVVDMHFRTFSGHTQVNATDLRSMRFPSRTVLEHFGRWSKANPSADQEQIDRIVENRP